MTSRPELKALLWRGFDALAVRAHGMVLFSVHRAHERANREAGQVAASAKLYPETRIANPRGVLGAVRIGEHSAVRGDLVTFPHGGTIEIGAYCYVGPATKIWSAASVKVGDRVLISYSCNIHDTNAHSLDARARHQHFLDAMSTGHPAVLDDVARTPIVIEDDVWIGFESTILKGVTIGRGSIVAARSLVTANVPPWVLVAGSPARVVRELPVSAESGGLNRAVR